MVVSFLRAGEQADLNKTLVEWQTRFDLNEWSIVVKPIPKLALQMLMDGADVAAASWWSPTSKKAYIFILARSEYTTEILKEWNAKNAKTDQKNSVIHELLHGVMAVHHSEEGRVQTIANGITNEYNKHQTAPKVIVGH